MTFFHRSSAPARSTLAVMFFGFASGAVCQEQAAEPDEVWQAFSAGNAGLVREIAAPGVPGALSVFGPQARALVTGGQQARDVVVACADWEAGRVVALGHDGYLLNLDTLAIADTRRFFLNALAWAGADKAELRVGVWNNGRLAQWLEQAQITAVPLTGATWWQGLPDVDVLVTHTRAFATPQARAAMQAWITAGGGLIAADCGWGWTQLNPGRSLVGDHPGNLLLYPAGLLWTEGYAHRNSPQGFRLDRSPSAYLNASAALEALVRQERDQIALDRGQQAEAVHSIQQALSVLPSDDTVLLERLRTLRAAAGRAALPRPQTPIRSADGLPGALVALDVHELKTQPARALAAHPAAEIFPGPVPPAAESVAATLKIDTRIPGWHSTGLYAVPGQLVVVRLPPPAAAGGLELRIGCHSDLLWGHSPKKWSPLGKEFGCVDFKPDAFRTIPTRGLEPKKPLAKQDTVVAKTATLENLRHHRPIVIRKAAIRFNADLEFQAGSVLRLQLFSLVFLLALIPEIVRTGHSAKLSSPHANLRTCCSTHLSKKAIERITFGGTAHDVRIDEN